jgi:hypothetical protein
MRRGEKSTISVRVGVYSMKMRGWKVNDIKSASAAKLSEQVLNTFSAPPQAPVLG